LATQPATRSLFLAPPLQAAQGRARPSAPDGFDRSSAFAIASDTGANLAADFQIVDVHDVGADTADTAGVGGRRLPAPGATISESTPGGQASPRASSTFLAQQFAQESLSDGIYIDPHPAGIAAYRDVLSAVAVRGDRAAGVDLHA
jgi:hypothetical protein